ncbi:MAG: hypothetical protein K0Q93_2160 [Nocardioidaceae bacterium]|jgi:hypothetical protein|nr:hypothetical protein [Nocardioidaceae bacterium]
MANRQPKPQQQPAETPLCRNCPDNHPCAKCRTNRDRLGHNEQYCSACQDYIEHFGL